MSEQADILPPPTFDSDFEEEDEDE